MEGRWERRWNAPRFSAKPNERHENRLGADRIIGDRVKGTDDRRKSRRTLALGKTISLGALCAVHSLPGKRKAPATKKSKSASVY